MSESLRDLLRVEPGGMVDLAGFATDETPLINGKDEAKDGLDDMEDRLFDLHEMLFAESDRSLLLVLQGMDASGKNGTIKHVVRLVNPAGVRVASFTEPTEEELEHEFLWRIRRELPGPGVLGVFNRSHYEDALVPIAERHDDAQKQIEEIVEFEKELASTGTTVVKVFPHISYDEQRRRFLRRLRRDDKRWKFSESDLETRRRWTDHQSAYGQILSATHTEEAPWFIVPADHKWYRNWAVARILIETMEAMNLAHPQPDLDLEDLRARLEPPL